MVIGSFVPVCTLSDGLCVRQHWKRENSPGDAVPDGQHGAQLGPDDGSGNP